MDSEEDMMKIEVSRPEKKRRNFREEKEAKKNLDENPLIQTGRRLYYDVDRAFRKRKRDSRNQNADQRIEALKPG